MLINRDDIIRYQGNIEIPQIGQTIITGFGEIAMSKETGVVFIAQFIDGTKLDKFIVGAFNPTGVLDQIKTFGDKTEKDFFEAVKYFEELIKERQPEEEKSPPSVGKFYFFKKSIGKDAYVSIGSQEIIIDAVDIPTVFSPPKTKPLGRLNLKDSDNPKYEPIKAKFALKYLKDECEEMAKTNNWDLKDFGIYDMTPYEFGDENEGEPPPDDVNEINPNDIEDEDLHKTPPEEKKKPKTKLPKVGDIIKIRENYGIVESIDEQTKKAKIKKLSEQEAKDMLDQRKTTTGDYNQMGSGFSNEQIQQSLNIAKMALGGEIKNEDEDFMYLEILDEDSELQILSAEETKHKKPGDDEDSDLMPFFRIANLSQDVLDLNLFSENKKTAEINNVNQQYSFIVSTRDGENFTGMAPSLGVEGIATLIRTPKYDGPEGKGFLLTAEGDGKGPGEPNEDEVTFVLVSNISTSTITGDLYSKNLITNEVKNLNKSIVFDIEVTNPGEFEGKVSGIDGKVTMQRERSLDQQNREAYYLLQEGEETEPGDDEPTKPNLKPPVETEQKLKPLPDVNPKDLKEALQLFFNVKDLKKTFRNQKNMISAVNNYNKEETKTLLSELKLPVDTTKEQFINLIEKETKQIFN